MDQPGSFAAKLARRCDGPASDIVITEHPLGEPLPEHAPFRGALRSEPFGAVVGGVSLDGRLARPPRAAAPPDFRVTAIVPAFNEADIIGSTIEYLIGNGVEVHVLDNWSTDETAEIARSYLDAGVVAVESFPAGGATGTFDLTAILTRTSEIAAGRPQTWWLQHDADERRESPWGPAVSLRDALWWVQELGYNAIDHTQIDFHPIDDTFAPGDDPLVHFRWFEPPIVARDLGHTQGWRQGPDVVDLASTGGHEVRFEGRKVFPLNFLLRHYGIRSQAHGERKILRERHGRWNPEERRKGWHFGYDHIRRGHDFIRSASELIEFTPTFYEDYVIERLSGQTVDAAPMDPRKRAAVALLRRTGLLDASLKAQRLYRVARRRDVARGARH